MLTSTGTSYTRSFLSKGTFYFRCTIHNTMQTTINVVPLCDPGAYALLDIDANGEKNAATDGLLVVRYQLGLRGPSLTDGAIGSNPNRTPQQIEGYLEGCSVP